jgi:hypothetical protein
MAFMSFGSERAGPSFAVSQWSQIQICGRPTNEKQVLTDQLALMLALSAGAAAKAQVEVSYDDENDEGRPLNSLRVLDRLAVLFMRSSMPSCVSDHRGWSSTCKPAKRPRPGSPSANRACGASAEEATLQSRGGRLIAGAAA